ncbi:hypothetical protein D3C72_2534770 [compost metagenome]
MPLEGLDLGLEASIDVAMFGLFFCLLGLALFQLLPLTMKQVEGRVATGLLVDGFFWGARFGE